MPEEQGASREVVDSRGALEVSCQELGEGGGEEDLDSFVRLGSGIIVFGAGRFCPPAAARLERLVGGVPVDLVDKAPRAGGSGTLALEDVCELGDADGEVVLPLGDFDVELACVARRLGCNWAEEISEARTEERHGVHASCEVHPALACGAESRHARPDGVLVRGNVHEIEAFELPTHCFFRRNPTPSWVETSAWWAIICSNVSQMLSTLSPKV